MHPASKEQVFACSIIESQWAYILEQLGLFPGMRDVMLFQLRMVREVSFDFELLPKLLKHLRTNYLMLAPH